MFLYFMACGLGFHEFANLFSLDLCKNDVVAKEFVDELVTRKATSFTKKSDVLNGNGLCSQTCRAQKNFFAWISLKRNLVYNKRVSIDFQVNSESVMESFKPAELVPVVLVEGKKHGPSIPPQVLFPTIYGLNKSFSKKIYMGLELSQEGYAELEVRLIGADFDGIRFNLLTLANFMSTFEVVSKFFAGGSNDRSMLDQKLVDSGYSIRFVISHRSKAIEIEEDDPQTQKSKKKYRRSVILKENTFDMLKTYTPLLIARVEYYKQLAAVYNSVMEEVVKQSDANATEKPSQRNDMPFKGDPDFSEEDFKRVWDMVRHNEGMQHVSLAEVKIIYNEIVHLRFNADNFCLPVPDDELIS